MESLVLWKTSTNKPAELWASNILFNKGRLKITLIHLLILYVWVWFSDDSMCVDF